MNDKQLARIVEIKETIIRIEGIKLQLEEKISKLNEEREAIELSDTTNELPPLEDQGTVEG